MENTTMKVLDYIEAIEAEPNVVEYEEGFSFIVNEKVNFDDVYSAIATIVENVVDNDFDYELIDLLIPYYLIDLFTDIEVPMIDDDVPDYEMCHKIAAYLNLEYELTQASNIVGQYIYMISQNVFRKLEYQKMLVVHNRELDALSDFYSILEELDNIVEGQKDIDVDGFLNKIDEMQESIIELTNEKQNDDLTEASKRLAVAEEQKG